MSTLKAAAARRDITPECPVEMRGSFSRRLAERVNDPLYARVLWLDDGAERAALVTCDLIAVTREMLEGCRAALADRLGLAARQVFLVGTHTHSAPKVEPPYSEAVVPKIVEAVEQAAADAAPATVRTARALVYGISFNRRAWLDDGSVSMYFGYQSQDLVLLDGPVDPILGLFVFEFEDGGRPPIVLANYSLHACTAGGAALSADYPAAFEQALREHLRQPLHLQFTQAPCGNVNHCDLSQPRAEQPLGILRWRVGAALAEAAARALGDARPIDPTPVRTVSRRRTLACRPWSEDDLEAARKVDVYDRSTWGGDFLEAARKRRILCCHRWGGERALEVQALRFGQGALAFMPGEDYVEAAIRIKKESPLYPHTYAVELSGDDISYVPTREAFPRGGYTVVSCRFEPGCGEALADEALAALAEAAG